MDLRLFFSTFALVFLAELGDKTQLAAMAASAGGKSPWSVFGGAASALVLSTLIAVLVGSTLQKYLPPRYLKIGASILFLAFGVVLLINALVAKPQPQPQTTAPVRPSIVSRLVLDAAAEFECARRRVASKSQSAYRVRVFDLGNGLSANVHGGQA